MCAKNLRDLQLTYKLLLKVKRVQLLFSIFVKRVEFEFYQVRLEPVKVLKKYGRKIEIRVKSDF